MRRASAVVALAITTVALAACGGVDIRLLPDERKLKARRRARLRPLHACPWPNFPDPTFRAGPGGGVAVDIHIAPGSGVDPQSPAFQAAQRICMSQGGFGLKGSL
jgi:hypothetical protein